MNKQDKEQTMAEFREAWSAFKVELRRAAPWLLVLLSLIGLLVIVLVS